MAARRGMGDWASVFTAILVVIAVIGLGIGTYVTVRGGIDGSHHGSVLKGLLEGSLAGLAWFAVGAIALAGATIAIAIEASSLHADDKADQILAALEAIAERNSAEHEGVVRDDATDTARAA